MPMVVTLSSNISEKVISMRKIIAKKEIALRIHVELQHHGGKPLVVAW